MFVSYHRISRDWTPGEYIESQVQDSVRKSRRTLAILSENYVNSSWCRGEFMVAHAHAAQDGVGRVIVVVYGDVPAKESMDEPLRAYVNMKTYLKWGDPLFWERLRYYAGPLQRFHSVHGGCPLLGQMWLALPLASVTYHA
jgi:hypothetical protein